MQFCTYICCLKANATQNPLVTIINLYIILRIGINDKKLVTKKIEALSSIIQSEMLSSILLNESTGEIKSY